MLLDTNILIYLTRPGSESLHEFIFKSSPVTSLISRVESLGFHRITAEDRQRLDQVFAWVEVLPVTEPLAEAAILLRQSRRMSLGDAFIAATALVYDLPLVTRNVSDFRHIPGLKLINPFEPAS